MGAGDRGDIMNKQDLFDLLYPIGSIYLSTNNVNPGTLFGNTWEQIQDTFLLAAGSTYSAGSIGGEANHTLTESELPSHTHTLSSHTHSLSSHTHTLSSHTHSLQSHTHSLQSHTHGLSSHTHSGPSHSHTVTNGASNGFATFTTGGDTQGTGVGFQVSGTYRAGYSPRTSSDGTGSTGGPSNNTSGGPSTNTSGGPSNNTSGGPSNNTSGTPSTNVSGTPSNDTSGSAGSGNSHNNMPPYLAVYMWKRIA